MSRVTLAKSCKKSYFFSIFVIFLFIISIGLAPVQAVDTGSVCVNESLKPYLMIATDEGAIEIELFERAAHKTVRRLIALVEGPIFNQDLIDNKDDTQPIGFYDGLTFDYIKPHLEISTSERNPAGMFQFETEIDADALGLNRKVIKNRADAMSVMQRELLAAYRKVKKRGKASAQLALWIKKFQESYNPDFLIGVSRKKINQALGYVYKKGLESKPVVKGSVSLRPVSPRISSARLTIILEDWPERTGRWMVIGHVAKGLDLADSFSVQPLVTASHIKPRSLTPLYPVRIKTIKWSCRD
ncbi:MAG: peptidylprolyl isomerase [Desulfobacterales bacterium]